MFDEIFCTYIYCIHCITFTHLLLLLQLFLTISDHDSDDNDDDVSCLLYSGCSISVSSAY